MLVIMWWRAGIKKNYKNFLAVKEKEDFQRTLDEKDVRIAEVEADNAALSRIIHSDSKMIPAFENAVRGLYEDYSAEKAAVLLNELNRACAERGRKLKRYKKNSKQMPSTRVASLDFTLDYMKQEAYENGIEFDAFVSGNIRYMVGNLIGEEQLRTVTADLLQNAINATKRCDYRNILFTIGICDEAYEVRVEDSGVPFEEETLRDLGKKQTTTHKNEGGSGIGMMEVFGIMKDTGASLIITRLHESGRGFTKRVRLRFDGLGEFRIEPQNSLSHC
ncbi:MAG: ATP-binding protein [Oscillospiraceae bacterium]|nr:ATP-binding protein [Oscillospiraceae bacterium]